MAMREDGCVKGSVSGGCIENDLISRVQAGEFRKTGIRTLVYGISADDAGRFRLPCGGTLELVVERVSEKSRLHALLQAVQRQELVTRELDLVSGTVILRPGGYGAALVFDGFRLVTVHGPHYRLVIIGAVHVSHYVAAMAGMLDYEIIVCDPREEYMDGWDIKGVQLSREMPDDLIMRLQLDSHSAVLTLAHDPKLDDLAQIEALKSPAFYVGALGSRTSSDKRRKRLALFDISEAEVAKLHGPVGMYIGARTPAEIAVSILAEMTAVRNRVPVLQTYAMRERLGLSCHATA